MASILRFFVINNSNIIFLFSLYCIFSITIYSPYPSSPQQSPHCCPCPWVLFPFFLNPSTPHLPPLHSLSSCSPSMSLSPCSLLVQFVHQIPYMSEIVWYLSLSDWLISLSIMFSRSIHTVKDGKNFFFYYGWVLFHCINFP